jgi:DNA-directed RNA polymerase specialized sigma subunit
MNVRILLYRYPHIPEDIQQLNDELNTIISCKRDTYNTLKSNIISDTPQSTELCNQVLMAIEKIIDRYGERIDKITEEINRLLDMQRDINKAYYSTGDNELTQEERRIIHLRFFEQFKWNRICYVMKYSYAQCHRIRDSALEKIERELNIISKTA